MVKETITNFDEHGNITLQTTIDSQEVMVEINFLCRNTLLDYDMVLRVVRLMAAASVCGMDYQSILFAVLTVFPHHDAEINEQITAMKRLAKSNGR